MRVVKECSVPVSALLVGDACSINLCTIISFLDIYKNLKFLYIGRNLTFSFLPCFSLAMWVKTNLLEVQSYVLILEAVFCA